MQTSPRTDAINFFILQLLSMDSKKITFLILPFLALGGTGDNHYILIITLAIGMPFY